MVVGLIGYSYYQTIFGEIVEKDGAIYIRKNDNVGDIKKNLIEFIGDENKFFWLAYQQRKKALVLLAELLFLLFLKIF